MATAKNPLLLSTTLPHLCSDTANCPLSSVDMLGCQFINTVMSVWNMLLRGCLYRIGNSSEVRIARRPQMHWNKVWHLSSQ